MGKAKAHLQKARNFLEADNETNGIAEINKAIADLKKVKKKKSSVKKQINKLKAVL